LEYRGLMSAIGSIEAASGYSRPTPLDLVWSPFEVLVFSSVPSSIWSQMMNELVWSMTPGDLPQFWGAETSPVSAQSAHPNQNGTSLYSEALEDALVGYYP
jgi:hypothetical protein